MPLFICKRVLSKSNKISLTSRNDSPDEIDFPLSFEAKEWVRKLVVETKTFAEEQQPLIPQKDSSCTGKNVGVFLA